MPASERCVYCRRREVDDQFRPFCSDRCKMADLGRWLTGDYALAGQPVSGTPADGEADLDEDDGTGPLR